jgi:arsenate reductase
LGERKPAGLKRPAGHQNHQICAIEPAARISSHRPAVGDSKTPYNIVPLFAGISVRSIMLRPFLCCSLLLVFGGFSSAAGPIGSTDPLLPSVSQYVSAIEVELDRIPGDRRRVLDQFADRIVMAIQRDGSSKLNFICTHNSRRSHLSQVWAQTAACKYGIDEIETYSGGTEATACNARTIAALRRAGFETVKLTDGSNPHYRIRYGEQVAPLDAFSKVYSDTAVGNPDQGFIAAMCCSQADRECPVVAGATARIPLHYEDPKVADNTPGEAAKYDERCRQIAIEMLYVMQRVAAKTRS